MIVRLPRSPASVGALFATSMMAWGTPSAAVDKVACVEAAEAGQRLRSHGELVSARDHLLVCASLDCPKIVSQDCTGWLGEVQRTLPSVVIKARDESGEPLRDVSVSVDGRVLPERAPTAAIDLDPGNHTFRCERAGFAEAETQAAVAAGERGREIVCQLVALTGSPTESLGPPAPPLALREIPVSSVSTRGGLPWVVWPLGGVGIAGIGGFVVLALSAKSDEDTLSHQCAPNCTASQVHPIGVKFAEADVSLAIGIAALGAATIIGLIHAGSSHHAVAEVARLRPQDHPPVLHRPLTQEPPQH